MGFLSNIGSGISNVAGGLSKITGLGNSTAGTLGYLAGGPVGGIIADNFFNRGGSGSGSNLTPAQQSAITKESVFRSLTPEQQKDFLINNPDIVSPYGEQSYNPLTNTITLSESPFQEQQRLKSQDLSMALLGSVNGQLPTTDGSTVAQAEYDRQYSLLKPDMDLQKQQLTQQLADQGIPIGSQAYNDAVNRLERSQGDQLQRLSQSSVLQGIQTAEAQRQQRFNEISALLGQSQVGPASFSQYTPQMSGTDVVGAEQASLNRALQQQQINAQLSAAKYQAIGSAIGGLASAGAMAFSDMRLKSDIKKIGISPRGINIYSFTYLNEPKQEYQGVMAQELITDYPLALKKHNGYYMVDYSKIDVEFKAI